MGKRTSLWIGACLALLSAAPARASAESADPESRSFAVCFTDGVRSCSYFDLMTTAFFDNGTRIGTAVDVFVRHAEGPMEGAAIRSALTGFYFSYAGSAVTPTGGTDVSDELRLVAPLLLPTDPALAPYPLNAGGWTHTARSSTAVSGAPLFDNYLAFTNTLTAVDPQGGPTTTQYIGGCGVGADLGAIDPVFATELWTCGTGASYWFTTFTDAWFDASMVNTVGVTTYARFEGGDFGVAALCDQYLDSGTSLGDADGTFANFGNVCAPDGGSQLPPSTTVPEPSTLLLTGAGIALLVAYTRRSRSSAPRGG